jgi:hypothetical protein
MVEVLKEFNVITISDEIYERSDTFIFYMYMYIHILFISAYIYLYMVDI